MSSDIMSKPVDVSKYGLIYAGVQKNMAPAGMAVVIIDKSLIGGELAYTPRLLSYKVMCESDSMYNTPPCYTIYMLGLMLKWFESQGGAEGVAKINAEKAAIVYEALDESEIFKGHAEKEARSNMNVTFSSGDEETDARFAKEAAAAGMENLKGHRSVGGIRASLYNAMPFEGAVKLASFIRSFK
jgi:phosphoserine aminotransferase